MNPVMPPDSDTFRLWRTLLGELHKASSTHKTAEKHRRMAACLVSSMLIDRPQTMAILQEILGQLTPTAVKP